MDRDRRQDEAAEGASRRKACGEGERNVEMKIEQLFTNIGI